MVASRLLVQRAKFALHSMVSAGVFCERKERLHFVEEKAKINANYYIDNLLSNLVEDARALLGSNFVAHGPMRTQEWLGKHCPDFTDKVVSAKQPGFKSAGLLHVGSNAEGI